MFRQFFASRDGATAVEFALVVSPFFALLVASMELSVKSLIQAQLDRQMFDVAMILSREDDAGLSKADYQANVVCGRAAVPIVECSNILFGARAFANNVRFFPVRNDILVDEWDTGCQGSTVVLELLYPVTHMIVPFAVADVVTYNGEPHYRSRGVIRREPLLTGSGGPSGDPSC